MMFNIENTKYALKGLQTFKKSLKKVKKQNKDIKKLIYILRLLANKEKLDKKYKDHVLVDSKHYKGCRECHIEPDWLLIYKYNDNDLILLLIETGSHSELF